MTLSTLELPGPGHPPSSQVLSLRAWEGSSQRPGTFGKRLISRKPLVGTLVPGPAPSLCMATLWTTSFVVGQGALLLPASWGHPLVPWRPHCWSRSCPIFRAHVGLHFSSLEVRCGHVAHPGL